MIAAKDIEFKSRHGQRLGMMAAICMGAFISHFTAGIVNVSLPFIVDYFQTELGKGLWITTGYLLVITALLPVMGKLGDRYGFRRIHNLGFVIFTVGSILVAFSPNLPILLTLRVIQGVGAAMFQATNIALITIHIPKEQRGRALGILSTAVALGGMTGPIAGGLIAEWLSWKWLFLIHVPVAIVATIMAYRYIPNRVQERKPGAISFVGAKLVYGIHHLGSSRNNKWEQMGLGVRVDDDKFGGGFLVTDYFSILGTEAKESFSTLTSFENSNCSGRLDR